MKKYFIKDEEGKVVEVSEYEEGEKPVDPLKKDDEGAASPFSDEQLAALRAMIAEEIKKALPEKPADPAETHDEEGAKPEEGKKKEEEEEAAKALEKVGDSKSGATSVEKPTNKATDSVQIDEEEVNKVWAARFAK